MAERFPYEDIVDLPHHVSRKHPQPTMADRAARFAPFAAIGMGLQSEQTEDNSMELQIRIAEIDAEFKAMLAKISTDTVDAFDEEKAKRLMDEKARLQQQLGNIRDGQLKREQTQSRLDDIYTILDGLKNRPMEYDEQIVRQLLECITVDSKEQITVIFVGGLKVVQPLID